MTKAFKRFLVAGTLTVLCDGSVYRVLLALACPAAMAKGISFAAGTLFAYVINKQWTFEAASQSHRAIAPFCMLYLTSMALNIALNSWMLAHPVIPAAQWELAFLVATGISAIVNFVGMRTIVFEANPS